MTVRNPLSDSRVPRPLPRPALAEPPISPELQRLIAELLAPRGSRWQRFKRWCRWFIRAYSEQVKEVRRS